MIYDIIESPVGRLTICADQSGLTGLHIEGDRYFSRIPEGWKRDPMNKTLQKTRSQLAEYFAGTRFVFDVPLAPQGTDFQLSVWQALATIPRGTTTTYGDIAARIGRPGAARAVGSAIGRNPICILLPCHRVLASDGSIGGYVAGLACKQKLLGLEQIGTNLTKSGIIEDDQA